MGIILKVKLKKKKPLKLTSEQRRQRKVASDHAKSARSIFRNIGFDRVTEIAETEINYGGQAGEFDDAFIYQNLIILVEYTTSQSSDVSDHLKKKKIIFSNVLSDPKGFIQYLRTRFPDFDLRIKAGFHIDRYILRIIYCSYNDFDAHIKNIVNEPIYLDFPALKYFEKLSDIIKMSALAEMFAFVNVDPSFVAKLGVFQASSASVNYDGSILPESSSGFPPGFKVVSFYADAASLLGRAYVLRRNGWRSTYQAYQRMVQKNKIESIRRKLKNDRQVFVNNIIATLPSDVHPVRLDGKTIDISSLIATAPVKISLPLRANSVGLIDGQHRLFSYYESREDDPDIASLRHQQNLLVTGIIYPDETDEADKERFEARLFLAINSNQTNAPTALRQEIEVLLSPFSPTAIGKQVMQRLAKSGPLAGHVENYFFDKGKLKTTSIVSYGLGPLIKLGGDDSLFLIFPNMDKELISSGKSAGALEDYIKFCETRINILLGAIKANVDAERWTPSANNPKRLITVTYINAFLITLRFLIGSGNSVEFDYLKKSFSGIGDFEFDAFHSSQYGRMAQEIYKKFF